MRHEITVRVNGVSETHTVADNQTLLSFLRDTLDLTGAKEGCNEGECGACIVLVDHKAVNSCLMLAVEADGHEVTTIEGLGSPDELHPLQAALLHHSAVQCGFCTPGMILTAVALLHQNPSPTEAEIRAAWPATCAAAPATARSSTPSARRRSRFAPRPAPRGACGDATASPARTRRGGSGTRAGARGLEEPAMSDRLYVGRGFPRVDGLEKVTGAARYTADLKFPRLLHAAVVRSPHPHARVLDVRLEDALAVPGVRAAVSGRDFPFHTGIYLKDQTVFAIDRVRFVGDPVAAVAAETPEAAAEAAARVQVDYEPLPRSTTPRPASPRARRWSTPISASTRSCRGSRRRPARTSATT